MTRGPKQHGADIETSIAELYGGIKLQIIFFAAETGVSAGWIAQRISTLLSPEGQGVQHSLPELRQEATGIRGAVEPLALAEHAHRSGTPSTIAAEPEARNARKGGWVNEDGSLMNPQQRKQEAHSRLLKRKDPLAKAMLNGLKEKRVAKRLSERERLEAQIARFETSKRKGTLSPTHAKMLASMRVRLVAMKGGKPSSSFKAQQAKAAQRPLGRNGKPIRTPEERAAKQKIYVERSFARRNGLPLPPLPKQLERLNAPDEKQRIYQARHIARKAGLPLPPLPGAAPAPETEASVN